MMAAGRPHAGRDYAWRGARCSILRSGDIAVRNTPAAGRCVRAVVTCDGIGGTGGFAGAVPLCVTCDGIGGTGGFAGAVPLCVTSDGIGGTGGFAGAVPLCVTSDGIGGTGGFGGAVPLGDGRGRVVAGPGSGRGAAGSGMMSSLGRWGARRSVLGDRVAGGRPERCDGGRAGGRPLADAQQRRRQLPAAAVQGGRYRADPVAGTGGCTQAEPPAASLPLLCDEMTSGSARPGPSRATCGPEVAGIHRVTAAAGPGSARQLPSGTGIVSRDAASRASWAPTIVMTASVRICSSGSPG
jgi:hypothetical protein